jgi:hypothetical protein
MNPPCFSRRQFSCPRVAITLDLPPTPASPVVFYFYFLAQNRETWCPMNARFITMDYGHEDENSSCEILKLSECQWIDLGSFSQIIKFLTRNGWSTRSLWSYNRSPYCENSKPNFNWLRNFSVWSFRRPTNTWDDSIAISMLLISPKRYFQGWK